MQFGFCVLNDDLLPVIVFHREAKLLRSLAAHCSLLECEKGLFLIFTSFLFFYFLQESHGSFSQVQWHTNQTGVR